MRLVLNAEALPFPPSLFAVGLGFIHPHREMMTFPKTDRHACVTWLGFVLLLDRLFERCRFVDRFGYSLVLTRKLEVDQRILKQYSVRLCII